MTKILKAEEFINEQTINEMGMKVRNRNIQSRLREELKKYKLVLNKKTGLYDCNGNVIVGKDFVNDGKFIIKFGIIKGNFDCSDNKLTSLEGAPKEVGGEFNCSYNKLTSLEGAPKEVGGEFNCTYNDLTSLEGAPQEVGGGFYCSKNELTSLEGAPQKVGGGFDCSYNSELIYDETHFYGCLPDVIGKKLIAGDGCDYELAKDYYDNK